jgi:hypothetical protein
MKRQSTVFDNDVRVESLQYKEVKRRVVNKNEDKEFVTKSGQVISVTYKKEVLSGVGMTDYYQITDNGRVIKPLTSQGVINYIKTK